MGEQLGRQDRLFYDFCLDDRVPADHLVRRLDAVLDLSWLVPRQISTGDRTILGRISDRGNTYHSRNIGEQISYDGYPAKAGSTFEGSAIAALIKVFLLISRVWVRHAIYLRRSEQNDLVPARKRVRGRAGVGIDESQGREAFPSKSGEYCPHL